MLIRIDRSSVRRNPDYVPPGVRRVVPDGAGGTCEITSLYVSPKSMFAYLPQDVVCRHCAAVFDHSRLDSDAHGDTLVSRICPQCGGAECCDVEYEAWPRG